MKLTTAGNTVINIDYIENAFKIEIEGYGEFQLENYFWGIKNES